jgi:hypothetical protein
MSQCNVVHPFYITDRMKRLIGDPVENNAAGNLAKHLRLMFLRNVACLTPTVVYDYRAIEE